MGSEENGGKIGSFSGNNNHSRHSNCNNNSHHNPMEISIAEASSMFPGFRFSPTDEELIQYYLKKKLQGCEDCVEVIPEVDICKHEPWDLPGQSVIQSENEWFFFSPRGKKYPNGSQSKRATEFGYWKATGKERSVKSGSIIIGTKRTLVFHTGRAPKGQRTEWIMHEYCLNEKSQDSMVVCRLRKNSDFHLNENPRRNSRDLSAANDSTATLSCGDQSGMIDGAKLADGCSSSYNSHSVEQVDSSESDDKGHAEEEDCYADIMKDDIIKLDDSSFTTNAKPLMVSATKTKSETKSKQEPDGATLPLFPTQGTANRRLRLRKLSMGSYQSERSEIYKFDTREIPIEDALDTHSHHKHEGIIDHLSTTRIKFMSIFMTLIMLVILLILLLAGKLLDTSECTETSEIKSTVNYCPKSSSEVKID